MLVGFEAPPALAGRRSGHPVKNSRRCTPLAQATKARSKGLEGEPLVRGGLPSRERLRPFRCPRTHAAIHQCERRLGGMRVPANPRPMLEYEREFAAKGERCLACKVARDS